MSFLRLCWTLQRSTSPATLINIAKSSPTQNTLQIPHAARLLSSTAVRLADNEQTTNSAEENLIKILASNFPKATDIAVVDVSGGCGSMYEVFVEAPDFKGLRIVKQHQLVTKALKKEIGDMHGIRISTAASPQTCS